MTSSQPSSALPKLERSCCPGHLWGPPVLDRSQVPMSWTVLTFRWPGQIWGPDVLDSSDIPLFWTDLRRCCPGQTWGPAVLCCCAGQLSGSAVQRSGQSEDLRELATPAPRRRLTPFLAGRTAAADRGQCAGPLGWERPPVLAPLPDLAARFQSSSRRPPHGQHCLRPAPVGAQHRTVTSSDRVSVPAALGWPGRAPGAASVVYFSGQLSGARGR